MGGKPSPRDRFRKRKKMNVLIVAPGKHPRLADIDESLESLQKIVGGYIEAIYLFEDEIAIICDEELKLKSEIEWNRILPETHDVIKGTFIIAGLGDEDFTEIMPELAEKDKQCFCYIELFVPTPNGLMSIVIRG